MITHHSVLTPATWYLIITHPVTRLLQESSKSSMTRSFSLKIARCGSRSTLGFRTNLSHSHIRSSDTAGFWTIFLRYNLKSDFVFSYIISLITISALEVKNLTLLHTNHFFKYLLILPFVSCSNVRLLYFCQFFVHLNVRTEKKSFKYA